MPQFLKRFGRQFSAWNFELGRDFAAEELAKAGNIIASIAKRRKTDRDHCKPIKEVLAEDTFSHTFLQITVSSDQNADVDPAGACGTDSFGMSFIEMAFP
jgi:hypothetical protein